MQYYFFDDVGVTPALLFVSQNYSRKYGISICLILSIVNNFVRTDVPALGEVAGWFSLCWKSSGSLAGAGTMVGYEVLSLYSYVEGKV